MRRESFVFAWQLLLAGGCGAPSVPTPSASVAPVAPIASAAPTTFAAPVTSAAPGRVEPPAAPTEPPAAPSPFVVRYACDDKYDEGAVCRPGKAAWDAWLGSIQLTPAGPNLLNRHGGGPGGAEWNPNAPLVAFVASADAGSARLKSSRATFKPVARFGDYDVFLLPMTAWSAAVRAARASDFPPETEFLPNSVVDLRALGAKGELARGSFAFSRGE